MHVYVCVHARFRLCMISWAACKAGTKARLSESSCAKAYYIDVYYIYMSIWTKARRSESSCAKAAGAAASPRKESAREMRAVSSLSRAVSRRVARSRAPLSSLSDACIISQYNSSALGSSLA